MRNHELTINGLTKSAARQLGQAFFSLSESMEMIEELSTANANVSREMAKLSMEAAGLRIANAGLKRYIKRIEAGNKPDVPTKEETEFDERSASHSTTSDPVNPAENSSDVRG